MLIKRFLKNKKVLEKKDKKKLNKRNKNSGFLYIKMIKSLTDSVLLLIKKPAILTAGIFFILIDFIFRYFTEEQAFEALFKFLNISTYPIFELQRMPFQLISSFSGELLFLGLFLTASSVISAMFSVSTANYIFEKKSIIDSIVFSFKNLMTIILFVLFFGLIVVFSGIILWIVFLFALASGLIGAIILVLITVLMGFIFLHFVFVPALLGKGMKIKKAFQESWNITEKNFISVLLLLVALGLAGIVFEQIYLIILTSILGKNSSVILIEMLLSLILAAYANILFPLFYLNKTK